MSNQIFYISGNRKFYINENSGVLVLNNLDLNTNGSLGNSVVYTTGFQNIDGSKTFNDSIVFSSDVRFLRNAGTADADIDLLSRPYSNTRVSIGTDTGILGESINTKYFAREIKIWETGGYNTPLSVGPFMRIGARGVLISEQEQSNVGIGTLFPQQKVHISGGNLRVDGDVSANNLVYTTEGNQTISGVKTFATGIVAPNIVYNTGNQTIGGVKTFASPIYFNNGYDYGAAGFINLNGAINIPNNDEGDRDGHGGQGGKLIATGALSTYWFNDEQNFVWESGDSAGSINTSAWTRPNFPYALSPQIGGYVGGSIDLSAGSRGKGGSIDLSNGGGSITLSQFASFSIKTGNLPIQSNGSIYNKINDALYIRKNTVWEKVITDKQNPVYTTGDQTISGIKTFANGSNQILNTTYSNLTGLKATSGLLSGQLYRISDFILKWNNQSVNDQTVKTAASGEPLIVTALSNKEISHLAQSEIYPQDTIYYNIDASGSYSWGDINNTAAIPNFKGWIYRRVDNLLNIDIPYDWRNITVNCCRPNVSSIPYYSGNHRYNRLDVVIQTGDNVYNSPRGKLYYSIVTGNSGKALSDIDFWSPASAFVESGTFFATDESYGFRSIYNDDELGSIISLPALTGSRIQQPVFTSTLTGLGTFTLSGVRNTKIDGGHSNVIVGLSTYQGNSADVYNNKIGNNCEFNTIGNNFNTNNIGNNFKFNIIGNAFNQNTIQNNFIYNNISDYFGNNNILDGFRSNTIGHGFSENIIGGGFGINVLGRSFERNNIGLYFNSNTIGNYFSANTMKNFCQGNTIGAGCYYNVIENGASSNTIGTNFHTNIIGNSFEGNNIGNLFNSNTIGNYFDYNSIGNNFYFNTIGGVFEGNTIGFETHSNIIGTYFLINTIGNYFNNNTIANNFEDNIIGNSFQNNTIESLISSINFTTSTHVYNLYSTTLFKNSATPPNARLRYFNSNDQLVVTDPTA